MKNPKDLWTHKKYSLPFRSRIAKLGVRQYFILRGELANGKPRKFVFDNYQQAKKAGWKKVG